MSVFARRVRDLQAAPEDRRWLYVPYDQLSADIGPLSRGDPSELGIVMVESPWKASRRPYHRQKLALVLANGRHFALEQAARGVAVRFASADGPYRAALSSIVDELGPLEVMRPAERELRADLEPLFSSGALRELPHEGWLSTAEDLAASQKGKPPWRMDAFYRRMRQRTEILMEEGRPVGGKYSFDADNRQPWPGEPPAPSPPTFRADEITREVAELIDAELADHPGEVDLEALPATAGDAEALWSWAKDSCMEPFGPYEDAMSSASSGLFHTRISGLVNLHRLLSSRIVSEVAGMDIPLSSKEGLIRQVLGWREFMFRVHERTDGFRELPAGSPTVAERPGDGGWSRWSGRQWQAGEAPNECDGGACPSALGADRPLPVGFWPDHPTGFACLDRVVEDVWSEAWSHHITRLMVLANIATLLDVSPRELTDWFWVAYHDAYDWVVEPNVLAMGTYGVGPLMTTKPYVSGANYINKMSDYCAGCAFDPKTSCPITFLYWAFLARHRDALAGNHRMRLILSSLERRSDARRAHDRAVFEWVTETLADGGSVRPEDRPEVADD